MFIMKLVEILIFAFFTRYTNPTFVLKLNIIQLLCMYKNFILFSFNVLWYCLDS